MNICHFMGNLTRDPELRHLANGDKRVVKFGMAVNRSFKRGTERVKETSFLNMEAWDTGADLIEKHFKKGDPIIVHCSIRQDTWDDKNTGEKRTGFTFRVENFEFVNGKKDRPQDDVPAKTDAKNADVPDEEIPF